MDYTCSIQYLHYLKGETNELVVSLQRRRKGKVPGRTHKRICEGRINLNSVLQCPRTEDTLFLCAPESPAVPMAAIFMMSLDSQPEGHQLRPEDVIVSEPDDFELSSADDDDVGASSVFFVLI